MQLRIQLFTVLLLACFVSTTSIAQDLGNNQYMGYILDDKGKKKEGVVEISSSVNPWENQRTVKFIPMKTWEKSKGDLKKKDKEKYKPKDITGYGFDGREFLTTKYTAASNDDAMDVNKVTGGISAISNLSRGKHFLERLLDGEMSVYKYYGYPPDASATMGDAEAAKYKEMLQNLKTPSILLKKGKKGKFKVFGEMLSFKNFIGDCALVKEKYENDEYMYKKGKFKVKNIVESTKDALGGVTMEDQAIEIAEDYNKTCG